jgi:U3 small nucleolar RNA-associated protein 23
VITQCCVEALYKLGPEYQKHVNTAKTFERRRCNHREPLDPDECLKDVIGPTNKHNYVLAAQSAALRIYLQKVPGLPVIHFNPRQVLVLSPPSIATSRKKNELEEKRRVEGEMGGEIVDGDNVIGAETRATGAAAAKSGVEVRGKRKTKAPNPLSMRKKKSEQPKRTREEIDSEAEAEGAGEIAEVDQITKEGEEDTTGKRRKKRKRGRGKGAVAEARAELAGMESGFEGEGGSGSDSE